MNYSQKMLGIIGNQPLKRHKEIVTGNEGLISEWKDFVTVLRMMEYRILAENPELADTIIKVQKTSPIR